MDVTANSEMLDEDAIADVATVVIPHDDKKSTRNAGMDEEHLLESDSRPVLVEDLPTFYTSYRLGPLTMLLSVALGLSGPVHTEFLKLSVCEVGLNISSEICGQISARQFKAEADLVVQESAHYTLYSNLVGSLPPVVFALFVGSWSDKFGRKLPMLIPFIGYFFSSAFYSVISNFDVSPNLFLVPPVIASLTGGWTILGMAKFSYLADYTTDKNRAMNYAVVDGVMILFLNLGGLLGGYLFEHFGRQVPFYVATALWGACFVYVFFVIRDHIPRQKSVENGCSELFSTEHLRESYDTLTKERAEDGRLYIYVLLGCLLTYSIAASGDASVTQLFLEFQPFGWSVEFYTLFNCLNGLFSSVLIVLVMVVFRKVIHISDSAFGFISALSSILFFFGYGVATVDWMIYLATALGFMKHMIVACIRSLLTSMVDKRETGKIMCVISALQAITPLFGSIIFTTIFAETESWFSGLCFLVAAFIMVPVLMGFGYVDVRHQKYR